MSIDNYLEKLQEFLNKVTWNDKNTFRPLEVISKFRNIEGEPYYCIYNFLIENNFTIIKNDILSNKNPRLCEYFNDVIGYINFVEDEINNNPDVRHIRFQRTKKAIFILLIDGENCSYPMFIDDFSQDIFIKDFMTKEIFDSKLIN